MPLAQGQISKAPARPGEEGHRVTAQPAVRERSGRFVASLGCPVIWNKQCHCAEVDTPLLGGLQSLWTIQAVKGSRPQQRATVDSHPGPANPAKGKNRRGSPEFCCQYLGSKGPTTRNGVDAQNISRLAGPLRSNRQVQERDFQTICKPVAQLPCVSHAATTPRTQRYPAGSITVQMAG